MKRLLCAAVATTALAAPFAGPAIAQDRALTKTLTGETKTVTATVEAIEKSTRTVTLKDAKSGEYVEVEVPAEYQKFGTMKVGDTITAKYYENIVLQLKPSGEKAKDTDTAALTKGGAKAGGTSARQRTITATITDIDPKVPSIAFSGPNGWRYSSRVEDKEALKKVKVGDRLDITWTTALLISVDAPK